LRVERAGKSENSERRGLHLNKTKKKKINDKKIILPRAGPRKDLAVIGVEKGMFVINLDVKLTVC